MRIPSLVILMVLLATSGIGLSACVASPAKTPTPAVSPPAVTPPFEFRPFTWTPTPTPPTPVLPPVPAAPPITRTYAMTGGRVYDTFDLRRGNIVEMTVTFKGGQGVTLCVMDPVGGCALLPFNVFAEPFGTGIEKKIFQATEDGTYELEMSQSAVIIRGGVVTITMGIY